jgi:hypothetical protein
MSLATIADVEAAYGSDLTTEEEPKIQWYLDAASNYIERFVGRKFTLHEDQVLICPTDSRGIIEIPDLVSVSTVEELDIWLGTYGALGSYGYAFDGIDKIFGLYPRETYRVTCTYGFAEVPDDVKEIVVNLVLVGTGLDPNAQGGLKSYRVGDVEEFYGITTMETGLPLVTLSSLMTETLYSYHSGTTTYRT